MIYRQKPNVPYLNFLTLVFILFSVFILLTPNAAKAKKKVASNPALALTGGIPLADIAEQSIKGVVNISSTKTVKTNRDQLQQHPFFNDPFFRDFFGDQFGHIPKERLQRSLGSGVIISKDGLVLTNNHVVENADEIQVTLTNNREIEAEIIGSDPKSDVAVLRLKKTTEDLTPIKIGNSAELRLGDIVLAIGNPFGLDHTVTMGIVSAKGRANVGITDYEDFIQTDAAINPGNSGGALINLKGELVGINTAIMSRTGGYQGIGFAIPSNMAQSVMNSLLKHGKVVRGWLGVAIQDLNKTLAEALNLKTNKGVLISDVVEDSPAAKAKLQRGDIIIKVNGKPMSSSGQLRNTVASLGAKSKAKLTIIRDGKEKKLTLILGELPDTLGAKETLDDEDGVLGGMSVAPITEMTRQKFQINKKIKSGVIVTQIEQGSQAQRAGLMQGDVILEVNRNNINTVKDFTKAYKKSKSSLLILIFRNNSTFYLVLKK